MANGSMTKDFYTDPEKLGDDLRKYVTQQESELKGELVSGWGKVKSGISEWHGDLQYRFQLSLSERVNNIYHNTVNFLEGCGSDINVLANNLTKKMNATVISSDGSDGVKGTANEDYDFGFKVVEPVEKIATVDTTEEGKAAQAVSTGLETKILGLIDDYVGSIEGKIASIMSGFIDTVGTYLKGDFENKYDEYKTSLNDDLKALATSFKDYKDIIHKTTDEHATDSSSQAANDIDSSKSTAEEAVAGSKENKWS